MAARPSDLNYLSVGAMGLASIGARPFMGYLSDRIVVLSARPGRIVESFDVPFDYPRLPELRFDPEFAKLSGEVSLALRGSHS